MSRTEAPARTLSAPTLRDLLIAAWVLAALIFVTAAVFAAIFDRFPGDEHLTSQFQRLDVPVVGGYFDFVNLLGETWSRSALIVTFAVLFAVRKAVSEAFFIAYAAVPSLINSLVKELVERPRPAADLIDVHEAFGGFSFPSGHTVGTASVMLVLFIALPAMIPFKMTQWLLRTGCLLLILSSGAARVYVGAHWPSDVVAGYFLVVLLIGPGLYLYIANRLQIGHKSSGFP